MITISAIKTERLILRPWKESDLEPFARLSADPKVMECLPATLSREESDALVQRMQAKISEQGWGFWAVEVPGVADFIGFIGLGHMPWEAHFSPAIEIGWRLLHEHWGKGYATEGARAALEFGFQTLKIDEIVAFTAVTNVRSRHVMEKLGMHTDPKDDFDHPKVPEGNPLKRQVLYRLKSNQNHFVDDNKMV